MHCASNRASLASALSQGNLETSSYYGSYRFQNTYVRIFVHMWTRIFSMQPASYVNMSHAPFEPYHGIQSTH